MLKYDRMNFLAFNKFEIFAQEQKVPTSRFDKLAMSKESDKYSSKTKFNVTFKFFKPVASRIHMVICY